MELSLYLYILKLKFLLNYYFIYCLLIIYLIVDELTSATQNTALKTPNQRGCIGDTSKSTFDNEITRRKLSVTHKLKQLRHRYRLHMRKTLLMNLKYAFLCFITKRCNN